MSCTWGCHPRHSLLIISGIRIVEFKRMACHIIKYIRRSLSIIIRVSPSELNTVWRAYLPSASPIMRQSHINLIWKEMLPPIPPLRSHGARQRHDTEHQVEVSRERATTNGTAWDSVTNTYALHLRHDYINMARRYEQAVSSWRHDIFLSRGEVIEYAVYFTYMATTCRRGSLHAVSFTPLLSDGCSFWYTYHFYI